MLTNQWGILIFRWLPKEVCVHAEVIVLNFDDSFRDTKLHPRTFLYFLELFFQAMHSEGNAWVHYSFTLLVFVNLENILIIIDKVEILGVFGVAFKASYQSSDQHINLFCMHLTRLLSIQLDSYDLVCAILDYCAIDMTGVWLGSNHVSRQHILVLLIEDLLEIVALLKIILATLSSKLTLRW